MKNDKVARAALWRIKKKYFTDQADSTTTTEPDDAIEGDKEAPASPEKKAPAKTKRASRKKDGEDDALESPTKKNKRK